MGGVDLADMLLALYRIDRRSKKYYNRIIFYLFGVCTTNAWTLYKINTGEKLGLLEFTLQLSFSLMKCGKTIPTVPTSLSYNRKKICEDIRYDNVDHMPIISTERQRCKEGSCGQKSFIFCKKCEVHLCILGGKNSRNCFLNYHVK